MRHVVAHPDARWCYTHTHARIPGRVVAAMEGLSEFKQLEEKLCAEGKE